ncbi:hypothetical protein [Oryzomicrobium sp.]|uniref:hypothetical protein n=1 Tax=Oryzomicrobium sp. TaxID=1911578 RepID=UPI0025D3D778|nr:hypothetical protein [Oryzomicrobium sp.]MCE1241736.1 hypothetical protein [Oryzomicrobium sp.]
MLDLFFLEAPDYNFRAGDVHCSGPECLLPVFCSPRAAGSVIRTHAAHGLA